MAKRDREHNIQGWFDPDDIEEKAVIKAMAYLQEKFPAMTSKWVLGNALLFAAQAEGFAPGARTASDGFNGRVDELFEKIDRLTFLIENGGFTITGEAAADLDDVTVQMDAISASVGGRYRPISFEDED